MDSISATTFVTLVSVSHVEFTLESLYIAHVVLLRLILPSNVDKSSQHAMALARKNLAVVTCVQSNVILEAALLAWSQ